MALYIAGPKLYRMLQLRFVFPSPSTLNRAAAKFPMDEGFQSAALKWLKEQDMDDKSLFCVIHYNEMSVRSTYELYKAQDQILLPSSKVQVVAVKSLTGKWKPVIYYKFDQRTNAQLLGEIVTVLEDCGLRPVLAVSDMDTSNVKIWSELGITTETPFCLTTSDNRLYFMADVPHLIKLATNHLLDGGYKVDGESEERNIEPVQVLMDVQRGCDLRLAPRLPQNALVVKGTQRQKVKTAVKLLSNSVAAGIVHLGSYVEMPSNTGLGQRFEVIR